MGDGVLFSTSVSLCRRKEKLGCWGQGVGAWSRERWIEQNELGGGEVYEEFPWGTVSF